MRTLIAATSMTVLLAACGQQAPAPDAGTEPPTAPAAPAEPPPPADPLATTAPSGPTTPEPGEQGGTDDWRAVVNAEDASRLGRLAQAWRLARAEAEDRGFADQVEALGPLVDPNAGQAGRLQPPPGTYRCRTIHMGSNSPEGLAFIPYGWFQCTVALTPGGDLILTKTTGSQRTRGLMYPDGDRRLVYVGATAWGADEAGYPRYGQMPERDQVGVVERIGSNRWRLVLPWPRQDAKLKIMELVR